MPPAFLLMWSVFVAQFYTAITGSVDVSSNISLRKCCGQTEIFTEDFCDSNQQNVSSIELLEELLYDSILEKDVGIKWSYLNGNFCVNNSFPIDSHNFTINGTILVDFLYGAYPADSFCVEVFNTGIFEVGALICTRSEKPRADLIVLPNGGMIISMPFLFITFLVYLILPDKNVHQYALMLYVLTLLLAYVLLVTINLSESLPTFFCTGAAYGTLFLFMVSFFWMNVICFDIWYTFSGGRGYIVSSRKSERKRFLIYTAYAVGIPILHVCIVALLDKYLDEESIHKPNIGIKKCFLDDGWPSLWYMYGEAAILVLINVVFFTLTALKIRQVKKETLMLKQNESKRHALEKEKRRFNLFLKLFLAMGVNWTMEVISWLVNWQTTDKYTYIWYITDFINAVYGGVIFFIFVFKRKIWKMLQKRYIWQKSTETVTTRTTPLASASNLSNMHASQ
ncbi:G-protein coupled receptor Mth2-like isoform X21 [Rhynchophorus ferrugineus]|uniref:G-protein coupled receptor Mth2-like isoform X21 n=1 Tax=Rhynchophorus ferrugineus TaxID=354439 RepID=UPI003FCE9DA6